MAKEAGGASWRRRTGPIAGQGMQWCDLPGAGRQALLLVEAVSEAEVEVVMVVAEAELVAEVEAEAEAAMAVASFLQPLQSPGPSPWAFPDSTRRSLPDPRTMLLHQLTMLHPSNIPIPCNPYNTRNIRNPCIPCNLRNFRIL